MKPEDFKGLTQNIISNLSDQAKVTDYLTQLNDAYQTSHTANTSFVTEKENYEKEIQALKDTNMKLFLKIQEPPTDNQNTTQNPSAESEQTYEKLVETLGGSTDGN